jgi:hypothetical protein
VDDDEALASPATTPPPEPTPGVGLFWRADPGHFSKAPKAIHEYEQSAGFEVSPE